MKRKGHKKICVALSIVMLLVPVTRICACNPDPPPDCSAEETALAAAEAELEFAIVLLEMARTVLEMRTTQVSDIKTAIEELKTEIAEINTDIMAQSKVISDLCLEIVEITEEMKEIALPLQNQW